MIVGNISIKNYEMKRNQYDIFIENSLSNTSFSDVSEGLNNQSRVPALKVDTGVSQVFACDK